MEGGGAYWMYKLILIGNAHKNLGGWENQKDKLLFNIKNGNSFACISQIFFDTGIRYWEIIKGPYNYYHKLLV